MDDRGNFVVAYTRDTNNNNPDVFAKRYNASNQLLTVINVATSSVAEDDPSVAMAPDGRFDVAWEQTFSVNDHDIFLNEYNSSGAFVLSRTIANTTASETIPSVAVDNSGNAVVAWQRLTNGNADILARRISSSGIVGRCDQYRRHLLQRTRPVRGDQAERWRLRRDL